jgi:LysM repeat protein
MKRAVLIIFYAAVLLIPALTRPATLLNAQEQPPTATATPDSEGVIYLQVQPGDTLSAIAFRTGISLDELRVLNGLADTDFIQAGQLLIIGIVTPTAPAATETADTPPTATNTRPAPTPSKTPPPPPRTAICLVAFADQNLDGIFEVDEQLQTAVAFTIYTDEAVIANYVTDGVQEPYCLEALTAGQYQITRSIGRDETLTTSGNRGVQIADGDVILLEFGSFKGPLPPTTGVTGDAALPTTPPIGISGTPPVAAEGDSAAAQPSISPIWVTAGIILFLIFAGGLFLLRRRTG